MSTLQKAITGVLIVACLGGLFVAGVLGSSDVQERRNAIAREVDRQRAERASACQGARGRAEVLAASLPATPELALEIVGAARELAAWMPYCGGRRIVISLTRVDVGQLRTDLIDFAKGH